MRRVVITGFGCVTPVGIGKDAFFNSLLAGRSGVARIMAFDPAALDVRIAGEVKSFDEAAHVAGKDRKHVGRAAAFALAASAEALRDAGVEPGSLSLDARRRFAVLLGTGGAQCEFTERQYEKYFAGKILSASVYSVPTSTPGNLSSELSMRFSFHGPSLVVSTGCTSASDALGAALDGIRAGRFDAALCGGADATITPAIMTGFCLMKVLASGWDDSPARASRPFSRDRNGFVLAEGAWMFVVEEAEHAKRRGAKIYAELAGYGATCDAHHRVRLEENGVEPARAMTLALDDAGLNPDGVDYVNLHGTSTELNDRVETRAARLALGARAEKIPMSATKSMTGHPQGASGALGVAAALCAMKRGAIPPTINLDEPDPKCDLDYVPHEARPAKVNAALVNCIGFGSKNAALALRRFP